jgi:drug/metabolite transporter superfamily protein YnfA
LRESELIMFIIKMVIAIIVSYCFYRYDTNQDNRSIYVAILGFIVFIIIAMIETIKECR